jgi:hypothetical protein
MELNVYFADRRLVNHHNMESHSNLLFSFMKKLKQRLLCLMAIQFMFATCIMQGQSVPTDLTKLKLEDILAMSIIPHGDDSESEMWSLKQDRFRFAYHYVHASFEGYQSGTRKISLPEMQAQFPVLPIEITQNVHLISLGYRINPRLFLDVQFSYVRQETYHISRVPGFDEFTIRSHGIGDTSMGLNYLVWSDENDSIHAGAAFILPTGSINEKGRTPRDAIQDTLLPYTMQLGSGTLDFNPSLTHIRRMEKAEWINQLQGTIPTGKNHHNYSLSHRALFKTAFFYHLLPYLQPSVKLLGIYWDRLHGQDDDLLSPGGNYPAPVTNPSLFGGRKVDFLMGHTCSHQTRHIQRTTI